VRRSMFWTAVGASVLVATASWAESPAIARPGLSRIGVSAADSRGLVFFLESDLAHGAVAVGTGHTLALEALARAGRVEFALPHSLTRVAYSERFAVPPGRPFSLADASLRGDFVVFLLSGPPQGVRVLHAAERPQLAAGTRVRVLGSPTSGRRDEIDAFGTVVAASPDRLEVDLDLRQSLDGWGGAPVVLADGDTVIGLVEAAVPGAEAPRVLAAPIDGVLEALRDPLEGGDGRPFASYAPGASANQETPEAVEPVETTSSGVPEAHGALLRPVAGDATHLDLEIEYPPDGANVSPTVCGAFVAGRAQATRGTPRRFDVIIVIDTSRSTADPSGTDVNGNGEVGHSRLGGLGAVFGAGISDPGDSILAAEVAAARQVLHGLDPRSTRVGLVAFAGEAIGDGSRYSKRRPAYTIEGLTRDYDRVEHGLDDLLATDPEGNTHMAAGVDQATIELLGLRGSYSQTDPGSEKVMFFFTDGQPTLPYGPGAEADNVRAVLRAANRASRGFIRIHSFAIGPDALEGPIAAVEMASRTHGYFTPVRNPGDLVDIVEDVSFAQIQEVTLENAGTSEPARPFRLTADGSWAGFVKLGPGANTIRAAAVSEDGESEQRQIRVTHVEATAAPVDLPVDLVVQRNRLLEDCLLIAKQQRLDRERERNEEIRRALRLEIERERREARERAAEQRKQLELEGDVGEDEQ